MSIKNLVVVLGKRLNKNELTAEGRGRVEAAIHYLVERSQEHLAVAFCGGITPGQESSEAEVMYQYFQQLESQLAYPLDIQARLLEKRSTNTIENIQNLAQELLESGLFEAGQSLNVIFVSNDYHLQRIFEIQSLMDAQGLLKVLEERCAALGMRLNIERDIEKHVAVPYPHHSLRGQLFLLIDSLTTYRVYLEGTVAGRFVGQEQQTRKVPARLGLEAIDKAIQLSKSGQFSLLNSLLPLLQGCIDETPAGTDKEKVREYLALLDTNLTLLNRNLDPEQDLNTRWWR
ncbi:YdcF family protein [Vibrio sp. D404a]|uniref:YdcF family protein n=1 Tax=unclassified Vibrio TaxID=2614977 RepID=UPI0025549935|nr:MULTISPECIES: YdcF family protein [unclassified Vibrio]MDK9737323.1 YdcF family protein [Vibrio sp. D404a]MDK9798001.1 YdcF family protein [Vibrio sp. D449a]